MQPLTVQDVMTSPVETVSMDETVQQIQQHFETSTHHHLVVLGDDNTCFGVISDRDLLRNISPFVGKMSERTADLALLNRKAHQIMTRQLVAVRPNTVLRAAARVMLDHRISCLPVLDDQRHCVGIITLRDLVKWSIDELEHPSASAA